MRSLPLRSAAAVLTGVALLALTGCGSGSDDNAAEPADTGSADGAGGDPDADADGEGAGEPGGAEVPEHLSFTTTTVDGAVFEGSSLAGEKAVLWFWAHNCPVCQAEAPGIKAAQEKWGDELTFVGVPGNGSPDQDREFVDEYGLDGFVHARDEDGSLWTTYGVPAQPAFAFLDEDGTMNVELGTLSEDDLNGYLSALAGR